jgi:CRP-like cAMP-binding protein
MEEKTERLRDIFLDVADDESVTERQTEQRGSLVSTGAVEDRLADVVARMRDRFEFQTDLGTGALCTVVERFYDGDADPEVADALGVSAADVFAARMDLHLVRGSDTDLDRAAVRACLDEGMSDAAAADELGVGRARVARARRVVEAERAARRVSHRFRTEFAEILTDADVAVRHTAGVHEDGLEEATEDIETDLEL